MINTFNGHLLRDKNTMKYFIIGATYDDILRKNILTENVNKTRLYNTNVNATRAKKRILNTWKDEFEWMDRVLKERSSSDWSYCTDRNKVIDQINIMHREGPPDIEIVPFSFTI